MLRLAIIDQTVSAGGVERFLHGLIEGAIESGVTDAWEIVLIRSKLNSAQLHIPWPEHLRHSNLHLQFLGSENKVSNCLNYLANRGRVMGVRGSGLALKKLAAIVRSIGSDSWRAHCGETRLWIEKYLRENHFDVVYFSYPYFLDPPRIAVPMVATPHDFIFKYGLSGSAAIRRELDAQIPRWLKACSRVAVSSQFVANDLKRFYPQWASKAEVIRLGIPSAKRRPTQAEIDEFRRSSALPERFVLVVGWIVEHKNQMVIFEAIAHLRKRGMKVPLVLVGPNSSLLAEDVTGKKPSADKSTYVRKILEFCAVEKLENGSDFFSLGYIDDFGLDCLYRCATMLAVPTLVEAGSFPAIEAMQAGCPVAFSQTPVYEEMIELVQHNAWTFPPHDGAAAADLITEVVGNSQEAQRRAIAAQEAVTRVFSWKKAAQAYFALFGQVADTGSTIESNSTGRADLAQRP